MIDTEIQLSLTEVIKETLCCHNQYNYCHLYQYQGQDHLFEDHHDDHDHDQPNDDHQHHDEHSDEHQHRQKKRSPAALERTGQMSNLDLEAQQ